MTKDKRFSALTTYPTLTILAILLLMGAASCGGGGHNATAPPIEKPSLQSFNFQPGHNIVGAFSIDFDPVSWTVVVRPDRSAAVHLDLSGYLNHQNCPVGGCLRLKITGYDALRYVYFVDMDLVNPTQYTAYDVRIIFSWLPKNEETGAAWEVANADSYTDIYDTDPDWSETEQWLNPFIAFEKEDSTRKFLPDPDGSGPAIYSDKEKLEIRVPPGSGYATVKAIVDECFFDGSVPTHCKEPYQVVKMWQTDPLPPGNTDPTSTVLFECIVADWQQAIPDEGIEGVSVYVPEILDVSTDGWVEMHEWPTTGSDAWPPGDGVPPFDEDEINFIMEFGNYDRSTLRKFWCNIANDREVNSGLYDAIVKAESVDTVQGYDTMYHRYKFKVDTGGSGGDPEKRLMIVFASYRNGSNSDIYAYHIKTSEVYRLTNDGIHGSDELEPCINTAGDKIAFITNANIGGAGTKGNFDIRVLDLQFTAGGVPIEAAGDNTGAWQPFAVTVSEERMPDFDYNGTTIAYCANTQGQYEIYTKLVGGGGEFRVTYNYAADEAPNWDRSNSAGQWLYFQSNRSGGGNYEIYGLNPQMKEGSGNHPTRYTFDTAFDGYPSSRGEGGQGLAWQSERFGNPDVLFTDFVNDTKDLTAMENQTPLDGYPSFSKDGMWVAFMSDRADGNMDIWKVTTEPNNPVRITNHEMPDLDPCYGGG